MSSPQLENGYTRIANELLDALCKIRIPGEARQVLDVITRKTYGYGKKEDRISLSQLSECTGLARSAICRALNVLVGLNLIHKNPINGSNKLSINKDFESWKIVTKKRRGSQISKLGSHKSVNKVVTNLRHTKESKETITKEILSQKIATAKPPKSLKEKYADLTPFSLSEFVASMRASPQRHIRIIAEYADTKKPHKETKGQWYEFLDRNYKAASKLTPYTDTQIAAAFEKLEKDILSPRNPKGFITKWTLETLSKYLDDI